MFITSRPHRHDSPSSSLKREPDALLKGASREVGHITKTCPKKNAAAAALFGGLAATALKPKN
jgi:hypothetical protein